MKEIIYEQAWWFVLSLCIGALLSISYALIRIFRRIIIHKSYVIATEDVLFWLIWTYAALWLFHTYADGFIHWYMILGILLGVFVGENTISSMMMKISDHILCLAKKQRKKEKKMLKNADLNSRM